MPVAARASTAYEVCIGLEVHAQLKTRSKMFCSCATRYQGQPPNALTCPVCLGLPGALPVINAEAIRLTALTALALHGEVEGQTKFDRKNYAYPDLPKGYQISQYDQPIGRGGHLEVWLNGELRRFGIVRVHLEEDTGKIVHEGAGGRLAGAGRALVDFNRSGVPLMEIVGAPDIGSAAEGRAFLEELRAVLRYLDVSDANMEEGSFRCDANISVRPQGATELGTKTEVKNMNSFRSVERALAFEAERQVELLERGEEVLQETRGWDEARSQTVGQRSKEYAHDYRYFPEPDLPPLELEASWAKELKANLPQLPAHRHRRYIQAWGLAEADAGLLSEDRARAEHFEAVVSHLEESDAKAAGAMLLNNPGLSTSPPQDVAALRAELREGRLSHAQVRQVVEDMAAHPGRSLEERISALDLAQVSDGAQLEAWADEVVREFPQLVADYRSGKEAAINGLVGQVMKRSRGQAHAARVMELLRQRLS